MAPLRARKKIKNNLLGKELITLLDIVGLLVALAFFVMLLALPVVLLSSRVRSALRITRKSYLGAFGLVFLAVMVLSQIDPAQTEKPNEIASGQSDPSQEGQQAGSGIATPSPATTPVASESTTPTQTLYHQSGGHKALRTLAVTEFEDNYEGLLVTFYVGESESGRLCTISFPLSDLKAGLQFRSRKRSTDRFDASCHWDGKYFMRSVNHNTWASFTVTEWDREKREGTIAVDLRLVTPMMPPKGEYLSLAQSDIKVSDSHWQRGIEIDEKNEARIYGKASRE